MPRANAAANTMIHIHHLTTTTTSYMVLYRPIQDYMVIVLTLHARSVLL